MIDEAKLLFGKRVKYLRRIQGLTQVQLAERTSFSVNYISQIETGVAYPTFEAIVKLANGLKVEIKEFFEFNTDK